MLCLLDHCGALKPSFRRHHGLIPEFCRSLLDAGIWSKLSNLFQGALQAWTSLLWPAFATPAMAPVTPNGPQMCRAALYTLLLPLLKCCPGSQTTTHCPLPLLSPHVPCSRDELNGRRCSTSQRAWPLLTRIFLRFPDFPPLEGQGHVCFVFPTRLPAWDGHV